MRIPTFLQFKQNAQLISQQYDELNRLVIQSTTHEKIQASSEDPVLAGQIKSESTFLANIQNYYNNGVLAQARSQLFSAAIQNSLNVVNDIQAQIMKAKDGTLSDQNRAAIAQQLQGDLSLLLAYANTTDTNGNYIFAGYNTNSSPYVQVNGAYQYQGGYARAYIDIGQNVNAMYYESGFEVFGDIFTGNGTFTISAAPTNTGTASTSAGSIVNQSTYTPDTYTLTFVTNSAGELAYQVVGAKSGQVIPPLPAPIPGGAPAYDPKSNVTFNGIDFTITGQPQVGDVFTIEPSSQENVFNTLQSLIQTLQSPLSNRGTFDQTISQLSASFTQISSHLIVYQSQLGISSAAIDDQININNDIVVNTTNVISGLSEAPIEQVSSALMQKQLALEATTAGYLKLEETLMQMLKL